MCCIFTCCGWMIDLVQRVWTFTMSCIIISAVGGVMTTASMSGIALGYNYSLAEYIDLKETNVSVYLKRGVFDDEIADDMDWRRSGHLPVAGHIKEDNLRTGAPAEDDSTTVGSGRRLDDSVFEGDYHNKYEGSLMKLTAKPLYLSTTQPQATADDEMAKSITGYPMGSLDQMKAIQSVIDSRRAMAMGGPTVTPLATYASEGPILPYLPSVNNPNVPMHPEIQHRRMMGPGSEMMNPEMPPINPARLAVPEQGFVASRETWLAPKNPAYFNSQLGPQFYNPSPTYPSPITILPATVRPTVTPDARRTLGGIPFAYRISPRTIDLQSPTKSPVEKKADFYNEKFNIESDESSKTDNMNPKTGSKSSEEEYEDEIKGLPVRKRRSIIVDERKSSTERNIINMIDDKSTKNPGFLNSLKNIFKFATLTSNEINSNEKHNFTMDENQKKFEEIKDSQIDIKVSNEDNTNEKIKFNKKPKSDLENKVEIKGERELSEHKTDKLLLDHLVTLIRTKETSLAAETTPKADVVSSTAKKARIKIKRKSFESQIVSSKYEPRNVATRFENKQPFSNQEILNSISVNLNEAGLLRNPASSSLVKLLQATLTA